MSDFNNILSNIWSGLYFSTGTPDTLIDQAKKSIPADDPQKTEKEKIIQEFGDCYKAEAKDSARKRAAADICHQQAMSRFGQLTQPAGSGPKPEDKKTPPPPKDIKPFESGVALEKLRGYVEKRRDHLKTYELPKVLLEVETDALDAFYAKEVKPFVPSDETEDIEAEYKALREFGLTRSSMPSFPSIYHYTVYGSSAINLGIDIHNLVNTEDPFTWDLAIPISRLMVNPRFTGAAADPLTPYERRMRAWHNVGSDAAFTLGAMLRIPDPVVPDQPTAAGEQGYTTVGDATLPNDTWEYILSQNELAKFQAESLYATSLKGLESATDPLSGIKWLDTSLKLAVDAPKLWHISGRLNDYQGDIERTNYLVKGDGTQCSAATESEVDLYRAKHTETTLTDEEIMREICDGKPLGSNEGLLGFKRATDLLTWNNYMDAYMATAFRRNLALSGDTWENLWLSGLFAAVQPVLNQLPDASSGMNTSRLAYDYAFEGGALGATILGLGKEELRQPLAGTMDLWTDVFTVPDAYALNTNFIGRDEPNPQLQLLGFIPVPLNIPGTIAIDGLLNGAKNYFVGVEAGDMFRRGLRANDPWSKVQYMSPLILGTAAHIVRGVRAYEINHSEYSTPPNWVNITLQIADPALYATGALVGIFTSNSGIGTQEISVGRHGLLGGDIGDPESPAWTWGLTFGAGGVNLNGTF